MTTSPATQAAQVRVAAYGGLVTGGAKTLPASTTGHLFTVSGGRVVITSLTGVVTTVVQAQACTIAIGNTPTGGSAVTTSLASASASVSGLAVGASLYAQAFSGGNSQALLFGGASGVVVGNGVVIANGGMCMVPSGTIDWTTSATNTGAIAWSVSYLPYDAGASITAL